MKDNSKCRWKRSMAFSSLVRVDGVVATLGISE